MTYIEFYDKNLIENICSCLVMLPERIVIVGDNNNDLNMQRDRYNTLLKGRGHQAEIITHSVNRNKMREILDLLTVIVETYDDCVFDLTGGDDVILVAVGMIFERYRDRNIQMHYINIRNNRIQDCDMDGTTLKEGEMPHLSVTENIRLYGGDIVYEDIRPGTTVRWDMNDDFAGDIRAMWDICRKNVRTWNTQIGVFAAIESMKSGVSDDGLFVKTSVKAVSDHMKKEGWKYYINNNLITALEKDGLADFSIDDESISIRYKNSQVKKCLTKAGQALEMIVYLAALNARENDVRKTYNDAMNGVFIDWDGEIHTGREADDAENEIDVLMMHDMVPVFVSCKNGHVDIKELYMLDTVANRFGGKYAKKVLVATAVSEGDFANHLVRRAEEMNITIITHMAAMDYEEVCRCVRTFVSR